MAFPMPRKICSVSPSRSAMAGMPSPFTSRYQERCEKTDGIGERRLEGEPPWPLPRYTPAPPPSMYEMTRSRFPSPFRSAKTAWADSPPKVVGTETLIESRGQGGFRSGSWVVGDGSLRTLISQSSGRSEGDQLSDFALPSAPVLLSRHLIQLSRIQSLLLVAGHGQLQHSRRQQVR